jgi:hypothetical protein
MEDMLQKGSAQRAIPAIGGLSLRQNPPSGQERRAEKKLFTRTANVPGAGSWLRKNETSSGQ